MNNVNNDLGVRLSNRSFFEALPSSLSLVDKLEACLDNFNVNRKKFKKPIVSKSSCIFKYLKSLFLDGYVYTTRSYSRSQVCYLNDLVDFLGELGFTGGEFASFNLSLRGGKVGDSIFLYPSFYKKINGCEIQTVRSVDELEFILRDFVRGLSFFYAPVDLLPLVTIDLLLRELFGKDENAENELVRVRYSFGDKFLNEVEIVKKFRDQGVVFSSYEKQGSSVIVVLE